MNVEEILSKLLKEDKKILHIGGSSAMKDLIANEGYVRLEVNEIDKIDTVKDQRFDYVILSDALELVDDPVSLIKEVKNVAKSTVVYEYKYDECEVDPSWKKPWQTIGLEYTLTREFDYVNNIFLGYGTVHICEMPYNPRPDDIKEHENAFR